MNELLFVNILVSFAIVALVLIALWLLGKIRSEAPVVAKAVQVELLKDATAIAKKVELVQSELEKITVTYSTRHESLQAEMLELKRMLTEGLKRE